MKKQLKRLRNEFFKTMITMVSASFALVAALAWNTSISEIIKKYIKPGQSIVSWLLYALIVTIIAALIGFYLSTLSRKIKKEDKELNE